MGKVAPQEMTTLKNYIECEHFYCVSDWSELMVLIASKTYLADCSCFKQKTDQAINLTYFTILFSIWLTQTVYLGVM